MRVYEITYRRWVNGQFEPLDHQQNVMASGSAQACALLRESLRREIEISRVEFVATVHFAQAA